MTPATMTATAINPAFDSLFARHAGAATPFLILPCGTAISHADFLDRAARLAGALGSFGVVPGDRVAAQIPKSADALALYAACVMAGAVFLPLNTAYTPAELAYFVTDSAARLFVADPAEADSRSPVATTAGAAFATLGAAGDGTLAVAASAVAPLAAAVPRKASDLAALLYTSGTTGRAKGAMLTHGNLVSNAETLARLWRFTANDRLLHALPVFHTHGLFVATNVSLVAGGAILLMPRFDADEALRLMPQATAMMGVPTFYTRLLDHPGLTPAATAHMRLFVSGSAPLLADTHRQWTARTGHRILERYGMTETNMSTSNPYDGDRRPGTVGPALPGVEVRVTDPATGAVLSDGSPGMVEVRGPNVFAGYWNLPDKTREELRPDGWFITGDIGHLSPDGYLTLVGRQKDVVIAGGLNIYPSEVEAVLDALPGVLESAVIGVPHADLGEAPVALVVPAPGATPDPAALLAALDGQLARFKLPRRVILVDALPRNSMGKVQKAALRASWRHALDPA
jgi:malonyl-CoA/methylmalonyl-CoA synthetase